MMCARTRTVCWAVEFDLQNTSAMGTPKRILVATDFSDASTAALEYAVFLAKGLHADVTAMHAYEMPSYALPDRAVPIPPDMEREIARVATRSLKYACNLHARSGVKIDTVVVKGKPWAQIERVADERSADLIVLGTHARGPLGRVFLVAEKVVRTSEVAVMVVPSKT